MSTFANISCYLFANLTDLKGLRDRLVKECKGHQLKGTILLSLEGINMFLAGKREDVDHVVEIIRSVPGLEKLSPKYSESDHQPFNRMLVRVKREIISFGVPEINPAIKTSRRISAKELKQWLDEGRPVTLYDTRNDYEVKLGSFKGAIPAGIDHFRQFPEAVRNLPPEMKEAPIVTFCTGGIRCEKAGPFMESEGFKNIFQLDGGILKYFEEVGGDHYEGECFVFDQRVGVDPALQESDTTQCYACQTPLTKDDQEDPRYVPPQTCPYCYKSPEVAMSERIADLQSRLQAVTQVLPGSVPYENRRPMQVSEKYDGATVVDFLHGILKHSSYEEWKGLCDAGRILDAEGNVLSAQDRVKKGKRIYHLQPNLIEPPVNAAIRFLHEDEAILVIAKPAPLPVHPCGRYNRNTLDYILSLIYPLRKIRAAHRIDANTTGILILTKARRFASVLQPQFARGEVKKSYLVRAQGSPEKDQFIIDLPISVEPGEAGTREADVENGLSSTTEFEVLKRNGDGTTLLLARPLTGRTNQIRVHLWEAGMPICGDAVYLPRRKLGSTQTNAVEDAPLCLHSWRIEFMHPMTKKWMSFETEKPEWAR
ncbi:MAG: pseudouridine synthase [Verrucomicrobiota bacterium]